MFSLIITIISIALVAALALATLYYGGDAFNQGRAGADASKLINEGQQVAGAVALAKATNVTYTDLASLSPAILAQTPVSFAGASDITADGKVEASANDDVCAEVQTRAGAAALSLVDAAAATASTQIYGCYGVAGAQTFFFNV